MKITAIKGNLIKDTYYMTVLHNKTYYDFEIDITVFEGLKGTYAFKLVTTNKDLEIYKLNS